MEKRGAAVFDVCGTITKTNNTFDFIGFALRSDRPLKYGLLLLIRIWDRLFRIFRIHTDSRRDTLRDRQIGLLKGYTSVRLEALAERYVNHVFSEDLLNGKVLEAMAKERERGREVLLVSAAIDPPIREIARRLWIERFYCSELEMDHGCCTGRLRADLLGRKESVVEELAARFDLRNSSVYSDNPEDARFMENFAERTVVVNGNQAPRARDAENADVCYLVNAKGPSAHKDVHSINERTVRWTYVPSLYYVLSRFHRAGLLSLLLREMIPLTLAGYVVTHHDMLVWALMPLSFLMFFSIYEIGGLVNDLRAKREAPGLGTHRIAPQVRMHVGLFLAIRVAIVGLLGLSLSLAVHSMAFYMGTLLFCLAVYLVHSLILGHLRILTFFVLKICRISVPLMILASRVPLKTLFLLCGMVALLDIPWRLYAYIGSRGLTPGAVPVRYIRCANTAAILGIGLVLYVTCGWWPLLVVASYYAVLDGAAMIRRKAPET